MSIPKPRQDLVVERRPIRTPRAAYAPEAVLFVPPWGVVHGSEAIRRHQAAVDAAFPESTVTILRYVDAGNIRAADWLFQGTHTGPIILPEGLVPATHRRVTLRGATFLRFTSERLIAEEHRYYDVCGLLGQLGLS